MSVKNPPALSLDERLSRMVSTIESDRELGRSAVVAAKSAAKSAEKTLKAAEAGLKSAVETRKAAEAGLKSAEKARKSAEADREAAKADRKAAHKAIVEAAEASRKAIVEAAEANLKSATEARKAAEADRDRFSRLEKAMAEDRKNNENSRRNLSRAMEDTFAASLPEAVKALGIVVRPEDVKMRVRKSNHSREYDFVAPNGELALVGEVKIRLTRQDVVDFSESLFRDFRDLFPEYAHLPIYGVVAGGAIDEDAIEHARKRGFIVLRMEGGKVHPATDKDYQPKQI